MSDIPLLLHALASWSGAGVFFMVGRHIIRTGPHRGRARRLWLSGWWWSLSAVFLLRGLESLVASFWNWNLAALWTVEETILLLLVAGFYSLTVALVYIYRGFQRAGWLAAPYYLLLYFVMEYGQKAIAPTGVAQDQGLPELVYSTPPLTISGVYWLMLIAIAPPILALFGYASLFFRAPDAAQRYRIAMSSLAILTAFLAMGGEDLIAGGQAIGLEAFLVLLAAALAHLAYRPGARIEALLAEDDAGHATDSRGPS